MKRSSTSVCFFKLILALIYVSVAGCVGGEVKNEFFAGVVTKNGSTIGYHDSRRWKDHTPDIDLRSGVGSPDFYIIKSKYEFLKITIASMQTNDSKPRINQNRLLKELDTIYAFASLGDHIARERIDLLFETVIDAYPKDIPMAQYNLGLIYMNLRRYDEARQWLTLSAKQGFEFANDRLMEIPLSEGAYEKTELKPGPATDEVQREAERIRALIETLTYIPTTQELREGKLFNDQRDDAAVHLDALNREHVPALILLLNDENTLVRKYAAQALNNIGAEAYEAAAALIDLYERDQVQNVRVMAIKAAARVSRSYGRLAPLADVVVPTLIEALSEPDHNIRATAANGLGGCGFGRIRQRSAGSNF